MTYTFGEVAWGTDVNSDKKKTNTKDLFLSLVEGDNEVRVVTSPFQYAMHKYKAPGDKGFGRKVVCSATKEDPNCPLCLAGDKAKRKWYIGVIDRKANQYKILDISFAVFSQIGKYVNNKRWGDITKYDINIVVDKNAGATGYYTVQPIAKEPLSAEDQLIVDNIDMDQIRKFATPPSVEAVQKKLDKIHEDLKLPPFGSSSVVDDSKSKGKKTSVPVASDEEFEEFDDN